LHLATDELALQRENTVMSSISEEQMLSDVEVYPADSEAPAPFSSASSPPRPIGKDEEDVYSDQSGSECGDADRMLNRAALPAAKITRKASGTSSHARPPLERLVSEDESAPEEEEIEYAMVIDGKTLGLLLDDDIKYLFLAVATQCKSVICCRCSPAQKASVVKLVTEPTLMFSPGNISLAIGDGANDVPMIQAANVGIGISGKEGRQAVLSSDYSFAQFRFLKRLVLVHGNYSYKRISKLILFSFMKNVALSLSNFFFAVQTMYSGLLMYFSIFFTLYNALFTTIPIVVIAMYNQDVSPAVLMQYPSLYVNGLKNRSFNWMSFFGWCGLGVWHAYVIYFVPFTSDGFLRNYFMVSTSEEEVLLFNSLDLGLWADGVAAYTYLIVASTAQVSLMTSNWTRPNVLSTLGTLLFYFAFVAFFCNVYGWTGADIYETEVAYSVFNKLVVTPWFWFGMVLATVTAVVPNYFAKAGRVLFYPEPSHLMREWNRLCKQEDLGVQMTSPRLLRRHTGFAFSHCPGESSMALFKSPPKATRVSRTGNAQNNNTSTESISNSTTNPSPDNDAVISSPAINNHHHSLDTSRDVGIL
jgi:magnesium-transporting ATPase (P-type)